MATSAETKLVADAFTVSLYPEAANIIDTMEELSALGRLVHTITLDDNDHGDAIKADLETQIAEYYPVATEAVLYTDGEIDALTSDPDFRAVCKAANLVKTPEVLETVAVPAGYTVAISGNKVTVANP